jgi:hypothetical protein
MADAFLLRQGSRIDFESINLKNRELGFQNEDEWLYLGTSQGNKHIPDEDYIKGMIDGTLGFKITKTVVAETVTGISPMVFKLGSFEYEGECVVKYAGVDFADFTIDADGNYTEVNHPVKRDSYLFIPGGLSKPLTGSSVVANMPESKDDTTQYFCVLSSDGIMTVYIETIGQVGGEKGIFTIYSPEKTTTVYPETTKNAD